MSHQITIFTNTALGYGARANTAIQNTPYIGRAWTFGRDTIVLPGARLVSNVASKVWTPVQTYGSKALNLGLRHKASLTYTGLALGIAFLAYRFGLPMYHKYQLDQVTKQLTSKERELEPIRTAATEAFGGSVLGSLSERAAKIAELKGEADKITGANREKDPAVIKYNNAVRYDELSKEIDVLTAKKDNLEQLVDSSNTN